MRILFNRKAQIIDSNMSNCNVGGQRDESCLYHILVINGIIHEQLSYLETQPIVIQQYAYTTGKKITSRVAF